MSSQSRRPLATISVFGISFLHRQNPAMVAWWSVIFPGFGHYLLNQYIRATLFTLTELITNTLSHVNEAIVYSFCGQFEMAKSVLQTRWLFGYLAIFYYSIWDGYRSAVEQNKMCQLAEYENELLRSNIIHPLEIQYLELKNPYTAAVYSFMLPGLGQVYNHRFGLAFYAMFWWWFYVTFSHVYESIFYFFMGNIPQSISVLHPHWLLFMPSVIGGSIYHAFTTTIEHNRLYKVEQRQHLLKRYQNSEVGIFD
jgi:hypothetical protein